MDAIIEASSPPAELTSERSISALHSAGDVRDQCERGSRLHVALAGAACLEC